MQDRVRELAFHDPLTGLPNRRLLGDRLGLAMAQSKRSGTYGAVLFLDLDNFKPLNDLHGHDAGDQLLIEVARRLHGCVREIDTVARFGGDEFVVILGALDATPDESLALARNVAEKIASTGNTSLGGPGVGFLISRDGGATWKLLDSKTNVDATGALARASSRPPGCCAKLIPQVFA